FATWSSNNLSIPPSTSPSVIPSNTNCGTKATVVFNFDDNLRISTCHAMMPHITAHVMPNPILMIVAAFLSQMNLATLDFCFFRKGRLMRKQVNSDMSVDTDLIKNRIEISLPLLFITGFNALAWATKKVFPEAMSKL
ncbi:hypothetical protein VIGAN_09061800, partial [Vigna angularis var. angularis]